MKQEKASSGAAGGRVRAWLGETRHHLEDESGGGRQPWGLSAYPSSVELDRPELFGG